MLKITLQRVRAGIRRLLRPEQYVNRSIYERLKDEVERLSSQAQNRTGVIIALQSRTYAAEQVQLRQTARFMRDLTAIESTIAEQVEQRTRQLQEEVHTLKQANAELDRLATQDSLTNLLNRRGLHRGLQPVISALARTLRVRDGMEQRKRPVISAILFDVDFFKKINDTYGHDSGDHVLRGVAELMRKCFGHRPEDSLCRYGGEEFLVILPHADAQVAHLQANLFLQALRETALIVNQSVTASAGVAELEIDPMAASDTVIMRLYHMADKAMYQAKSLGRDRVEIYSPEIGK